MTRKASVGLEADVAGFLGPVLESARATEKLKDEVDDLDHSLDKIPPDALKAGAAMKLLSSDVKDVGANIGAVGDRSTALTILDTRIKNTRAEVKKLGDEFVKTGDVEVFKKLGQASGDLQGLTSIRKKLAKALDDGARDGGRDGAKSFSQLFQGGIISAFSSLPTELKFAVVEGLVAAIVVASAPIGAALNGALLGGIGLGGIGLGIAGQMSNPVVHDAFGKLGSSLMDELTRASASFAGPLVNSAKIFGRELSSVMDHLRVDLQGLAPFIEPLARGIAGLFDRMMPGLDKALGESGPILKEIAAELPGLGASMSKFFALIADGGKGAKDGINLLFLAIETLVVGIGGIIDGLSHLYEWFLAPGKAILGWYNDLTDATTKTITPLHDMDGAAKDAAVSTHGLGIVALAAGESFTALNAKIGQTAQTADALAASMVSKIFTATMNVDQAAISWNRSLLSLHDTLEKNGKAIDRHTGQVSMNTAAGLDNRSAVLAAVSANMQQYQAFVAAGGSAVDAAAQYDTNTAALEKQMRQAGYTQKQIDGLIGKYKGVPASVNTAIAMQGLTDAINGLADLIRMINHIPLSKNITVTTTYRTSGTPRMGNSRNQEQYGGILRAAEGLIVPPSDPGTVLFGEPATGGEAYIPLQGISQGRAMDLAQTVGDSYGFQVSRAGGGMMRFEHTLKVADGGTGTAGLATLIAKMARTGELQMTSRAIVG